MTSKSVRLVNIIEDAIIKKGLVEIKVADNLPLIGFTKKKIIPLKLVYVDGDLELIGEELNSGRLSPELLESILEINTGEIPEGHIRKQSAHDVLNYLDSCRLVEDNEERLVLKMTAGKEIPINTNHLYFGSPFAAVNPDGDMIWAASVEISDALFEWLSNLKDVEILDPPTVNHQFANYLQNKKK